MPLIRRIQARRTPGTPDSRATIRVNDRRGARLGAHWRGSTLRNVLGIEWNGTAITVTHICADKSGEITVPRRFFAPWPPDCSPLTQPDAIGRWLRDQLQQHEMPDAPAIVSLARRDTVLRMLELPLAPQHELPPLIRMQVQARCSVDVDKLHLDYLPHRDQADTGQQCALAVTISRTTMDIVQGVMQAAGVDAKLYGVGELSLGAIVPGCEQTPASLAVLANRKKLELVLLRYGVPVASHAEPMRHTDRETGKWIQTLVRRMLRGLPSSLRFASLESAAVLGPNAAAWTPHVRLATHVPTRQITTPCDDSVRALALYRSLTAPATRLDFWHPRSAVAQQSPSRKRVGTLACLAASAGLWAGLTAYHHQLDRQIASTARHRRQIERQLAELSDQLVDLPRLTAWHEAPRWAQHWAHFQGQLPDVEQLCLLKLQWSRDARQQPVIHAAGLAKDIEVVSQLQQKLLHRFEVVPQAIHASTDAHYPYAFELHARPLTDSMTDSPASATATRVRNRNDA